VESAGEHDLRVDRREGGVEDVREGLEARLGERAAPPVVRALFAVYGRVIVVVHECLRNARPARRALPVSGCTRHLWGAAYPLLEASELVEDTPGDPLGRRAARPLCRAPAASVAHVRTELRCRSQRIAS
jgi:hypothetical protein